MLGEMSCSDLTAFFEVSFLVKVERYLMGVVDQSGLDLLAEPQQTLQWRNVYLHTQRRRL